MSEDYEVQGADSVPPEMMEKVMERNAELEVGIRNGVSRALALAAAAYQRAQDPVAKMAVANLANTIAFTAHKLGAIPLDLSNKAFNLMSAGAADDAVLEKMAQITSRRSLDKAKDMMAGEDVPDHEEDGLFIGWENEEEDPDFDER